MALHWVILLFVAVFALVTFAVNQLRQLRSGRGGKSGNAISEAATIDHGDCERTIANLNATVTQLRQSDATRGIRIQARDGEIATLKSDLDRWTWLHEIARVEKSALSKSVHVLDCEMFHKGYDDPTPEVKFRFLVFNASVFPVTVDDVMKGFIRFGGKPLKGEKMLVNRVRDLGHGASAEFEVWHEMSRERAKEIASSGSTSYFDFVGFEITVKAGSGFDDVLPQRLPIKWTVSKDGESKAA